MREATPVPKHPHSGSIAKPLEKPASSVKLQEVSAASIIESVRSGLSNAQPVLEGSFNFSHLVRADRSQAVEKRRDRDRLNLLEMESARPQERLLELHFPAVAPQGGRVRDDGDERQFVVRRIIRQQQARPGFRREAKVDEPDLTPFVDSFLPT